MIVTTHLQFDTRSGDRLDITDEVQRAVQGSRLASGIATVFVPGATGAVTTIECEPRDAILRPIIDQALMYSG